MARRSEVAMTARSTANEAAARRDPASTPDTLSPAATVAPAEARSVAEDRAAWPAPAAEAAGAARPGPPPVIDPGVRLAVAENGRIVIPKEMRAAMDLGPDGAVTARLVDGELRLISPRAAIARAQRRLAHLATPGVSVVDEFLAERRAMWGEE
jgi:bifunctional DNA-binding transcriptional regulator/antitoxin component of YhaV-PrlF toxin-antitoxin module